MTFAEQYIATLERIYQLTKSGQIVIIETDFSIPKMLGAWSSIFWALPNLDKFNDCSFDELKSLVRALIKVHMDYSKTTNQYLRTETVNWIAGIFKNKAGVYGLDNNEGLYAENWVKQLFDRPYAEYQYTKEIGQQLMKQKNEHSINE